MRKVPLMGVVVAAVLVALALAFNPTPAQHREHIKTDIAERSPLAGALGLGALAAFSSTYHSLGVASYTTVNRRLVSVGAFGLIVVLQPEPAP